MILRSGFQKPSKVKLIKCPKRYSKRKQKNSIARPRLSKTMSSEEPTIKLPEICDAYTHRDRKACYIQTEDSKTVRFDVDEDNNKCNISIKDSQSYEDIAWLDIFTKSSLNVSGGKNLVTLSQKSNNKFLLLSKDETKQLYLKVLECQHQKETRQCVKKCTDNLRQLTEQSQENQLFIMHGNQENSVKFQCYGDENYYLHVNKESVNLKAMEETDADGGKDFRFMVKYVKV